MGIGITLNELIKRKNTNVNELATKTGVSAQTIYGIIKRDNKKVDFDVLVKISKILGVNVEYFYNAEYSEGNMFCIEESNLSTGDYDLIQKYNQLSLSERKMIDNIIDAILFKNSAEIQEESKESE